MKKRFFYVAILSLLSLVSFGQGGFTPIPKLKITTTPDTNNSTTEVLVRDATTGNVGKVAKSTLSGTLDSVTDAGANTTNAISTGGVGINTTTPDAIFDVVSTSSGILIPRMTTTQRNAISSPVNSMLIYNSTTTSFEYYKDAVWYSLLDGFPTLQEVLNAGNEAVDSTIKLSFEEAGISTYSEQVFDGILVNQEEGEGLNQLFSKLDFEKLSLNESETSIVTEYRIDKIVHNAIDYLLPSGEASTIATLKDLETGYVPLSGTTTGNPITGDIEMNSFSLIKAENETYRSALTVDVDNNLEAGIYTTNKDTNDISGFSTNSSNAVSMFASKPSDSQIVVINVTIDGVIVTDNGTTQRGLRGDGDYSANITNLDYTQKIYVDNQKGKLISLTNTEILAIASPEVGRLYYNNTIDHVVYYNGTDWKKISNSNM